MGTKGKPAYDEALRPHVRRAHELYAGKMRTLAQAARLHLEVDGSNDAATLEDVRRYLVAVEEVLGPFAYASARLSIYGEAIRLQLDTHF